MKGTNQRNAFLGLQSTEILGNELHTAGGIWGVYCTDLPLLFREFE